MRLAQPRAESNGLPFLLIEDRVSKLRYSAKAEDIEYPTTLDSKSWEILTLARCIGFYKLKRPHHSSPQNIRQGAVAPRTLQKTRGFHD
jgi:hypothetical protein